MKVDRWFAGHPRMGMDDFVKIGYKLFGVTGGVSADQKVTRDQAWIIMILDGLVVGKSLGAALAQAKEMLADPPPSWGVDLDAMDDKYREAHEKLAEAVAEYLARLEPGAPA